MLGQKQPRLSCLSHPNIRSIAYSTISCHPKREGPQSFMFIADLHWHPQLLCVCLLLQFSHACSFDLQIIALCPNSLWAHIINIQFQKLGHTRSPIQIHQNQTDSTIIQLIIKQNCHVTEISHNNMEEFLALGSCPPLWFTPHRNPKLSKCSW